MKVVYYRDVNTEQEVNGVNLRQVITSQDGAPHFTMTVYEITAGSSSPSHSHPYEHGIFVFSGSGLIVGNEGSISINKDNVIYIPPNEPHCLVNTGNEPLRYISLVPEQK